MSSQSHRRPLALAIALLALALTAPAAPAIAARHTSAETPAPNFAVAVPTRPGALTQPADTDASVAQAGANSHDKRGAPPFDASIGTYTPGATPAVSYTSGASAGGAYTPGTTAVHSATPRPLAGPPTWPKNPQPIVHARAVNAPTSEGGINWTTIGLGIVGSLLTITGLAAVVRRNRRIQRTRVTA